MRKIYATCPGKRFTLSSTLFLEGETFQPQCPYRLTDAEGVTYDTQWSLVATLAEGIQVEIMANITRDLDGDQTFTLSHGENPVTFPATDFSFVSMLDKARVLVVDQNDETHVLYINFLNNLKINDLGPCKARLETHVKSESAKIGMHAFLTVTAGRNSWELDLNFHNGFKGTNHFYFKSIYLYLPSTLNGEDLTFSEAIPYGTKDGNYLVSQFNHMIPSRRQFSRRLHIHKVGDIPASIIDGWGMGNYFNGGYLVQNFPVGHIKNAEAKSEKDYQTALSKFLNNHPDSTGGPVVSHRLWSSASGPWGGQTGGIDIEQVTDADTVDSKNTRGLLTIMIRQLRYRNRHMGAIINDDGQHFAPQEYLDEFAPTPWLMFSNEFQKSGGKIKDDPFFFSTAKPNQGSCPYEAEIMGWKPIDHQHLIRATRDSKALAWLMNDPLSKLYLKQDAELQKMAYWTGVNGRFSSFGLNHDGMEPGREFAWILDCVATAAAIDHSPRGELTKKYVRQLIEYASMSQLPTGWLNSRRSGKVITDPPFSGNFYGGQTYEACFVSSALMGAFQATGDETALVVLKRLLSAIKGYAWHPTLNGPRYVVPTHQKGANGVFSQLTAVPESFVHDKTEKFNAGVLIGLAKEVERLLPGTNLDSTSWFLAYTGKTDLLSALAEIEKLQSGDADTTCHQANTMGLAQKYIGGLSE